jgi:YebC/PmpR family DNA-binding regulatory protein
MSGHSHWKTIKHKKGTADAKRGKLFTKVSRLISAAVKQGGADPAFNPRLKLAVEQARSFNMPNENIERAIKRVNEGQEDEDIKELLLEGFGPDGTTLLIFAITNSTNRTLGDVRQVLSTFGGKLGEEGSVRWLFDQKGILEVPREQNQSLTPDELEIKAIDAGAVDTLREETGELIIFCAPADIERIKNQLTKDRVVVGSSGVAWIPKNPTQLPPEKHETYKRFLDALDELDDVQDVYTSAAFE